MVKFYKLNIEVLKFDIHKNEIEIKFNHYLMKKENLQRIKGNLETGYLYLTASTVAQDLNINISKSKRLVKKFVKLGILSPYYISNSKHKPSIYCYTANKKNSEKSKPVNERVNKPVDEPVKVNNIEHKEEVNEPYSDSSDILHSEQSKIDNLNYINKNNIYSNVIDYLNNKTNRKFKASNKQTQSLINARMREGYGEKDFISVIDVKCKDWLKTEFEQYLRPTTLFGQKFESYINQNVKKEDEEIL